MFCRVVLRGVGIVFNIIVVVMFGVCLDKSVIIIGVEFWKLFRVLGWK